MGPKECRCTGPWKHFHVLYGSLADALTSLTPEVISFSSGATSGALGNGIILLMINKQEQERKIHIKGQQRNVEIGEKQD